MVLSSTFGCPTQLESLAAHFLDEHGQGEVHHVHKPRMNRRSAPALPYARFFSNSLSRRSLMCLEVTNLPSLPKNGELLMVKSMLIVGSSMEIGGRASGCSLSAIVSPISKPSMPTTR